MQKACILCGELLSKYPTNREHYVPQVLIREFNKLCIPSKFDWAMRVNQYNVLNTDKIVVPRSQHKTWAVVDVHQKCNQDASGMCRDLRYIIDNTDKNIPSNSTKGQETEVNQVSHTTLYIDLMFNENTPVKIKSVFVTAQDFVNYYMIRL